MSFDLKLENGDLVVSSTGDLQIIQDNEKLRQDVLKLLVTPLGANKLQPWYGSGASKALIGFAMDKTFSTDAAIQQIKSSLDNLQLLQQTQAQSQVVTAAESILAVKNVYVGQNKKDPRVLEVSVSILTKALTPMDVKFLVRL